MAEAQPQAATPSDEELVDRIRDGDEAAFREIYERYFPRIYRYADRRLPSRDDTEETVQEIFFNVFSSIHTFRGEAPFVAWVFGLTRRTIANRFKKRTTHVSLADPDTEPDEMEFSRPAPDPLQEYECMERLSRIQEAAVCELTQEQWALFQLHHLENRPIHEIARSFAKSEDSVKSHLYRARKALLAR